MRGLLALLLFAVFSLSCASHRQVAKGAQEGGSKTVAVAKCSPNVPCHHRLSGAIDVDTVVPAILTLESAEKAGSSVYVLELNTPGGGVAVGFELAKAIENAAVPVVCVVDGRAASMGFYILQACPLRVMTRRSVLMTHEPSIGNTTMGGPANDWKALADALAALREAMAWYCNRRLTTTLEEYHARTDGGLAWWFTYTDAKKFGAVDVIVDTMQEVLKELRDNL